jgi:hypothetical protein
MKISSNLLFSNFIILTMLTLSFVKKLELLVLSFGLIFSFLILYIGFITNPTYGTLFFADDDTLTLVIDDYHLDYEINHLDTNISVIPGIFFLHTRPSYSLPTLFEGNALSDTKFNFLFRDSSPDSVITNITELNQSMLIYTLGPSILDIAFPLLLVGFKITNSSNPQQLGCLGYEFNAFPVTTTRWSFDHEHSYFALAGINRYQTHDVPIVSNVKFPYAVTYYELYHGSSKISSMNAQDTNFFFNASKTPWIDQSNYGSNIPPLDIDSLQLTMSMNISVRWIYGKV